MGWLSLPPTITNHVSPIQCGPASQLVYVNDTIKGLLRDHLGCHYYWEGGQPKGSWWFILIVKQAGYFLGVCVCVCVCVALPPLRFA